MFPVVITACGAGKVWKIKDDGKFKVFEGEGYSHISHDELIRPVCQYHICEKVSDIGKIVSKIIMSIIDLKCDEDTKLKDSIKNEFESAIHDTNLIVKYYEDDEWKVFDISSIFAGLI